ncbi:MAG TPA: hypothetical protein VFR97_14220 [Capillimicrobium sp.]|nr:hypothetical protein [Capillimicrobium sp.]
MTQAAQARDTWADTQNRRPRREIDSWASAEELEVLGGLGEERVADWTVLTIERDDAPGEADVAQLDNVVQLDERPRRRFASRDVAGGAASRAVAFLDRVTDASVAGDRDTRLTGDEPTDPFLVAPEPAVDRSDRPEAATRTAPAAAGGRRTVVIRGQVAPMRPVTPSDRRRPAPRARDRVGHRPDRVAMWAFILGLLLIVVATMTAG